MAGLSGAPAAPLVLVADDEPTIRDLVIEVLGEAGYRTVPAGDGDEAVRLAMTHRPVLIVMDVMMPTMDGYATLARLSGHPYTREIPVIILTGQSNPVYKTLSVGVGAVAHITKPFSPQQLIETVERVLAVRPT